MSDTGIADPFAGLDLNEATARDHAAMLVKGNALTVEAANAALAGKSFAPLNANALDYAQSAKDSLLSNFEFVARYSRGEPEAIAQLYKADIRITQSRGNLTDRENPTPASYDALRREVGQHVTDAAAYVTYATELSGLASSIGLPPANAKALAEDHFAAVKTTNAMSLDELTNWAEQQTAALHAAIGPDVEAQIAAASKILTQKSGRSIDIAKIAKSNGVAVAVNLIFQSQVLSAKGVR